MTAPAFRDILVGTEAGLFLARADGDPSRELEGRIDALSTDRWGRWALVDGRALWRSVEGSGWVLVARLEGPPGRCLLATDDGLLVGTAQAGLLRLEDGELRRVNGFDDAPGRDTWYTPWGGPPDTRSLSRAADGTLFANVHVGGILRSSDGERWEPTIEVDADVHQVLAHPDDAAVVLAAAARGLLLSPDHGATWSLRHEGLHGRYCRAVAVAGEHVLVSASTGPFTDRAAVYRTTSDGAAPLERCTADLPDWFGSNIDTQCLDAGDQAAVLGTDDGAVYRSGDAGRSWERATEVLPSVRCLLLAERG